MKSVRNTLDSNAGLQMIFRLCVPTSSRCLYDNGRTLSIRDRSLQVRTENDVEAEVLTPIKEVVEESTNISDAHSST